MYGILIVDDEPMICDGLKAFAHRWNYSFEKVLTARNGEDALAVIEKESPQILITDIRMPKMDGVELLQRIRDLKMDIHVIVLSGYDDFEYVRAMAVLGIENYLLKPVNHEELEQTLKTVIKHLDQERSLKMKAQLDINLIRENIINRWMYGSIGENELQERAEFLELDLEAAAYQPCILRLLGKDLKREIELKNQIHQMCVAVLYEKCVCYSSRNYDGDTIVVFCRSEDENDQFHIIQAINQCMERGLNELQVKLYVLLGSPADSYWKLAESFSKAVAGGIYLDKIPDKAFGEDHGESNSSSPFSLHLANYVLEHYEEDLSLKTLALHFRGNAAYIGQIFKRDMGRSFSDYLKEIRIEKAKELLKKGTASAKEISAKVGFQNTTYFCAVFKKETGVSPAEYKKIFGDHACS